MNHSIRVLILEDQAADAELVADALRQSGLAFDWTRVDRRPDFLAGLKEKPDIVLADFNVPEFGGLEALDAIREQGSDVPAIIITGTLGDEIAAECIKRGASDFLLKDRLSRLGAAVEQALERKRMRAEGRQGEQILRQSEIKYRELIEQATDGIFVTDAQGNFSLVNRRLCEMVGYSEAEFLRLNVADTYVEAERGLFADRLASIGKVRNRLFERMIKRKDGSLLPVEISVRRLSSGLNQGIARDVTERMQAAVMLAESEGRFKQVAENIRDAFLLVDLKSYSVLYVSPAYEEIWGRTCASLYADARSWIDAVHPDDRDRVVQMHGIRRTTGQFDAEFRIVRPDGKLRWIHARAYPIRDALGNLYRSAGVAEDVTERKQAETRIRSLNRVHTVLSGVNALIVRATSREELYHDACRIAVEAGQFVIAWIGVADREALKVTPVASDGDVRDFFDSAPLTGSPALASGHGLAWQAIHEKKAVISNDVRNDPRTHMKKQCADRGINSMAILPLSFGGEGVGVLSLYARESGFFDEEEMKLLKELAGDISFALDHIEKSNRLDYLAYYDAATGIANRQLILERLDQRIRIAAKQESLLALAILDIERFKSINDTLGRQVGNQVLKVLADRFVKFHGEPDRVGRVLGDQFGIIIPDVRSEDDVARRIDQKMKECIGIPIRLGDGEPLRISAKVGIALYPYDGADADTLFRNAEAALKRAKATGERYLFYTQKMTERVGEKLALEGKLRQALENEEFVLHYQPKVDMATRKITGVEALIRWQSPELGLIAPMQFIPLLEQTGLILEVGAWALRRAALDYRRWTGLSLNAPRIAVNVSSIQVRRPDFAETTLASIEAEGGRSAIDLEVTESIIMEDVEVNVGKFEKLRLAGIEIAIDDFGTGYSSLGYLAKLPLQWLKIDRSFIITMLKSPAAMTLVSTIISMAHALKLKVIAEGVEAESQAKVLKRLGCDQMQGYLFSKPVDFDAITVLLRRQKSPGSMMGTAR